MPVRPTLPALILAAMLPGAALSDMPAPVLPEILLTPGEGSLTIEGVLTGTGPAEVTATLTIAHRGAGGTMQTSQSRTVTLGADDARVPIASTGIDFGPASVLTVELTVTAEGAVVARAEARLGKSD